MPIEVVLLDIGGVLEDTPRTGWERRWADRLGLEPAAFERRLRAIWRPGDTGEATLPEIERVTARAFGLDESALAELMADAWDEYLGTLNTPVAEWFASLRPRYRTGIVSNSFVGAREREAAAHRLPNLCDTIVYSHEVGCRKPDPEIYRIACARLDVKPERALFVDDVEANVQAARRLGMWALTFTTSEPERGLAEVRDALAADDHGAGR